MKPPRTGRAALCVVFALCVGCAGVSYQDSDYGWLSGPQLTWVQGSALALRWSRPLNPEGNWGPYQAAERAIAALDPVHDRVYVGSTAGALWAFESSGRPLWRYEAMGAIESEPALDPDTDALYLGTEEGEVHAVTASTGAFVWKVVVGGPIRNRPLLTADALYVVTEMDLVVALSREDGSVLWRYRRDAPEGFSLSGHSGLLLDEGRIVVGFTDGVIAALDVADGRVLWERDTTADLDVIPEGGTRFLDVDTTPVRVGESLYAASFAAGLYELAPSSGSVRSRDGELDGVTSLTALGEDRLLVSRANHGLLALRAPERTVLWRRSAQRGAPGVARVAGPFVYVGETEGSFYALAADSGREVGRIDAGTGFSSAASIRERLGFVLSNGGVVFAFRLPGGEPVPRDGLFQQPMRDRARSF